MHYQGNSHRHTRHPHARMLKTRNLKRKRVLFLQELFISLTFEQENKLYHKVMPIHKNLINKLFTDN